jgi:glycosyltransferase involved in cell wall biosynthesis
MYSDSYGSLTTTFIKNEVLYLSEKYNLTYLAQKVEKHWHSDKAKVIILPFLESKIKKKINWILWKMDIKCSFKNNKYAKLLNQIIDSEKPDIIHCHFAYEALKILDNIDNDFQIPIFIHFHGYDASQMLLKKSYVAALKKHFRKQNVYAIAVSKKIKNKLKNIIPHHKIYLLYCGIDLEKFKVDSFETKDKSKKIFVQNSSLSEKKGHKYSLEAFALFLNNHPEYKDKIEVIFTGDGPQKKILEQYAVSLGIEKNVRFIGNVDHNQVVDLLSNADVFIHHSVTTKNGDEEGIPTAIMEAMAMGLPILSTFHSGIPELVKHGVNGLLCNEKDIKTYASQIAEIIHWNKLPNNRLVIENNFNMLAHIQKLEEYHKETIIKEYSKK